MATASGTQATTPGGAGAWVQSIAPGLGAAVAVAAVAWLSKPVLPRVISEVLVASLELRAKDPPPVGLPRMVAHGASCCILLYE